MHTGWPIGVFFIVGVYCSIGVLCILMSRKSGNAQSFLGGMLLSTFCFGAIQDFYGQERFIQLCKDHWVNYPAYVWLLFTSVVILSIIVSAIHIHSDFTR